MYAHPSPVLRRGGSSASRGPARRVLLLAAACACACVCLAYFCSVTATSGSASQLYRKPNGFLGSGSMAVRSRGVSRRVMGGSRGAELQRRPSGANLRRSGVKCSAVGDVLADVERTRVVGKSWLKCQPVGVGSCAPQDKITNFDLEKQVNTSDEWISQRTGISARHVLCGDGKVSSLAAEAAKSALENAGVSGEDIDLVIVATSSPDDLFGDATSVAHKIGATKAVAFDLTAACSGFMFAMITAGQYLDTGFAKKAVVVGADALSRWVDWNDRNSCILFGDGAGAVVLEGITNSEDSGILGFAMHSDGAKQENLVLPYEGIEQSLHSGHNPTKGGYSPITMNGKEVYKFATSEVPRVIKEALDNAGMQASDIDYLLLHQANIRIMEVVAKKLGLSMDQVIANIDEYGNTSAGSMPLALDEAVRSGKVKKGDVVAFAGFGAGLSWGSAIVRWGQSSSS
mmetsp:Transcript_4567/g.8328  ORF Transcript_4567/g.8328 Transcript_4567/m.8328 type:complete len:458 (-) Transcript_4567:704-2077(-)